MKFALDSPTAVLTTLLVLAPSLSTAHYTFPKLSGESDWSSVRQTSNWQNNGPVTDVSSEQIRCFERNPGQAAPSTATVQAGGSIRWSANQNVFHEGALSAYMAKVPSGSTAAKFNGAGQVWFKVYQDYPTTSGGQYHFPSLNKADFSFPIPSCLPSGDYLFRIEHVALHSASSQGGAQFYISCAQITVTGGKGSKSPSGNQLVSFPGAYSPNDPGLLVNIYNTGGRSYAPAGPAVFTC